MGGGVSKLASVYGPVTDDLPRVADRLLELASEHDRLLGETLEHVFQSGGKLIRPALVLLSAAGIAIFFVLSALSHFALRRWHESAVKRER
jgi:NitT/TauT family transport system permease protein